MRYFFTVICSALVLALFAGIAPAQQQPGGGRAPMMHDKSGKDVTPEQFAEMKARILTMLEERKTRMEQEKTCVEAAKTADELRKCRPEPPMGPMGGQGGQFRGGPRGQQPGQPGTDTRP